MTISGKMMTGFSLVILIMALANGYVLYELHRVSDKNRATLTSDVQVIDNAKQLKGIVFDIERNARKYLVARDEAYQTLFTDDVRRFARNLDTLDTIPHGGLEDRLVESLRDAQALLEESVSAEPGAPGNLDGILDRTITDIHETLDRLVIVNQMSIDRTMSAIERTTERSVQVAYVMLLSAIVLALAAALLIASTITRPIRRLIDGTTEIAKGSFGRVEIRSRDEIGRLAGAVNEMSAKLKALEDLRGEMMHHIAHELRTPLTTMMTAHYVLTQQRVGPLNAEQLRLLAAIRQNIDRLTDFSYDFLDLAKIEAGMMQFSLERTDPVEFVNALVEEARLNASQKEISVVFDSVRSGEILIDRRRFSHVVTNLLSNAIKYSGRGGKITVSVTPFVHGTRISVSDTGPGIASEDLSKVFQKFYRVKNAEGKGSRGTGVGLALVKAVTEAFGGSVSAASRLGEGSTFTVELPPAPREAGLPKSAENDRHTTIGHG